MNKCSDCIYYRIEEDDYYPCLQCINNINTADFFEHKSETKKETKMTKRYEQHFSSNGEIYKVTDNGETICLCVDPTIADNIIKALNSNDTSDDALLDKVHSLFTKEGY